MTIQQLVAQDRINEALKLLVNLYPKEGTHLQSRFSNWNHSFNMGLAPESAERNRIINAILALVDSTVVVDNSVTVIIGPVPRTQTEYVAWIEKQPVADIFAAVLDSELPVGLRDDIEDLNTSWKRKVRDGLNTPTATGEVKAEILKKFNEHLAAENSKKSGEELKFMAEITQKVTAAQSWDDVAKAIVYFIVISTKMELSFKSNLEAVKYIPTMGSKDDELLQNMRDENLIGDGEVNEAKIQLNKLIGKAWSALELRGITRS